MAEVSEVHVRVNGWCDTCGGLGRASVEHKDRTDRLDQLAALDLTDGEWRFLAESALQARFGWSDRGATNEARVALSRRWLQIAAVLHPAAGQHPAILAGRRTSEDGS